jgi:hypothetical protein
MFILIQQTKAQLQINYEQNTYTHLGTKQGSLFLGWDEP